MRILLLVALVLFAALVGARLHGFSLPAWHAELDGSPAPEVLLGEPRQVRIDDWVVDLPLALAQRAHEPAFPRWNRDIGIAQDLILWIAAPILHPVTVFRPEIWGFFLGADTGLAWLWWSRALGIFVVWSCVAWFLAGRRAGFGLLGGALVLFAPIVEFWGLKSGAFLIFAGLLVIAAIGLREARSPRGIAGSALLLAYSLPGLVLTFYPPYQVSLGWVVVAVVGGWLWASRDTPLRGHGRLRAFAATAGAILGVALCAAIAYDARDAIATMAGTAYPGRRISTGGDFPLVRLMSGALWAPLRAQQDGAAMGSAISWLFFPLLALAEGVRIVRRRTRTDPVCASLIVCLLVLFVYATAGFPIPLARATGLSWVPATRLQLAFCVADAMLLVRLLARAEPDDRPSPLEAGALSLVWVAFVGYCAFSLHAQDPSLGRLSTGLLVVANGGVGFAILRRLRPALVLAGVAAAIAVSSLWFNPIVRGGSEYLMENPLSRRLREIDRDEGGRSVWAVFGTSALANLPRMLGVRSLGGVQPSPQLELWRRFDPGGTRRYVYNRFAHVIFEVGPSNVPELRLIGPDGFAVRVAPGSPALRCAGVTHVLLQTSQARPEALLRATPGLVWLSSVGRRHFFRLEPRGDAPACE